MSPELAPARSSASTAARRVDAHERVKLFKLIWDAIGSEFGGRHELYETQLLRQPRAGAPRHAQLGAAADGLMAKFTGMVDDCMSDYDLDGFTAAPWANA